MYRNRNLTIAAITMAALLGTGIFTTTSVFAGDGENKYKGGDRSETNTEQKLRQENFGDGTNTNCGQNLIDSSGIVCFDPTDETGADGGDAVATCEECIAEFEAALSAADALLVGTLVSDLVCDGLTETDITALEAALDLLQLSVEGDAAVDTLIACLLESLV
jgi:hypothetical protein